MQTYALIRDGVLVEWIGISEDGPPLEERYHPDIVAACVLRPKNAPPALALGWLWDGEAFSPPPEPEVPAAAPEPTKAELMAEIQRIAARVQAMPD